MRVVYISHSSYFVELERTALLFDYWKGEIPKSNKKLFVFVSHAHGDHFNRDIFKLRERGDAAFILSSDIRLKERADDIYTVKPNMVYNIDGIRAETLKSTDEGVAFSVNAEGKSIYHAGDLNLWVWAGESKAYNNSMRADFKRYTAPLRGRHFDIGFIPLDPRQEADSFLGLDEYTAMADFKTIFPMHFWDNYDIIKKYKRERNAPNVMQPEREGQTFFV